jgi:tetratricopeptide (TPR) repeat protein
MKPEHRHELKTNELADWIANFPEWVKENTGTIVYLVVVLAIVAVVAYLKWYRPTHTVSRGQLELMQLAEQLEMGKIAVVSSRAQPPNPEIIRSAADRLDAIVPELSDKDNAAFALIKRGEALRAELHYSPTDFSKDPGALEFQINKAKNCYQQAIEKAADNPDLTAMAQFGLGLCEEELGNFEDAQKIYSDIAKNEKYAGTVTVPMARERIADMADYKGTFAFVEPPRASITPSMPLGPRIENLPQVQKAPVPAAAKPAETNKPAAK